MSNNSPAPSPDQELQLFKKQERIYPKRVSGFYRNLKWAAMIICLAIYYLTPFIRWDRGPNAPDQAVLIDLESRRAYWFFIEIWPQEIYILTGILILAAIGLFFITSLFGRVWCGYLCFQTVWTDLFIWVERIIQGDRVKRQRLREGPWTFEKIWKMAVTHMLWLAIGWVTAGSFVLYFNDAPTLVMDFLTFNVSSTVLGFVVALTFSTYLMAGFAREQVCIFMCPYSRFQSAMFDQDTLVIGYDELRGEPRGKHKKGADWSGLGDCVDCSACVQVCPMGIDIRNGLQMECIACGLCIDACDEIMDKVGLERGLIRYDTERRLDEKAKGLPISEVKILRPRTFYYMAIIAVVGSIMIYALASRKPLELTALHDRNPLFTQLSNGDIRNGYDLKILNKTHEDQIYRISVQGIENSTITMVGAGEIDEGELAVAADSVGQYKIFVQAPLKPQEPLEVKFTLEDIKTGMTDEYESMFITKRPH
jgi:cytochrome c oxidase accessory protein FixG